MIPHGINDVYEDDAVSISLSQKRHLYSQPTQKSSLWMSELQMESPECPVCLQNYDAHDTIPRVLPCGHSACHACLLNFPQRFSGTIRCPSCNVLVKYPIQGPSALPKNIDLLRISLPPNPTSETSTKPINRLPAETHNFLPQLWSDEFYKSWKDWVLPHHAISFDPEIEDRGDEKVAMGRIASVLGSEYSLPVWVSDSRRVSLARVVSFPPVDIHSVIKFGYVATIMKCLSGMKDGERNELGLMLRAGAKSCGKVCKALGLWGNLEDGFLYLVCERQKGNLIENVRNSENGFCGRNGAELTEKRLHAFAMIAVDICEALLALRSLGLSLGFLCSSCFVVDHFGRICIDLNEAFVMGKTIRRTVMEAVFDNTMKINEKNLGVIFSDFISQEIFISPEVLVDLLEKEGMVVECGSKMRSSWPSCDVWSLACVLLRLLIGSSCFEKFQGIGEENCFDFSSLYINWMKKDSSLLETKLGSEGMSLLEILCGSFNFNPESRPCLTYMWKCLRELIILPELDIVDGAEGAFNDVVIDLRLVLGELIRPSQDFRNKKHREFEQAEVSSGGDSEQVGKAGKDVIESLSDGTIKCKDLLGHHDSVSGLVIGGNFLFSSSYDKTILVWSLQDFSHVHTFKGHEHRVVGVVYVDGEQPLCVSADNGGGIFIWSISMPLEQGAVKKWNDEKDWRYSGIHALAYAENGYIYTGGGDKSVKAWLLKDQTLSCTLSGHKSAVSALAVCQGVLYSGSWDGTIRLWSLADHSALAVLAEDSGRPLTSVLSLVVDRSILVATDDNGFIRIWRNDAFVKSVKSHQGAIFCAGVWGKWVVTGGWDKSVNVQEFSGEMDIIKIGCIPGVSAASALLYWQGRLFVGYADRFIKVYYNEIPAGS